MTVVEEPQRPADPRSDEQLLAAAQQGDMAAFEEVYRRYHRPILAYVYQIVRDFEDAACIAQDVFMKVFEHRDRFDTTRRFTTWFYTIARNAAIDYLQSHRRRVTVSFTALDREEGDQLVANTAEADNLPIESMLANRESGSLLRNALDQLPQIYREIVELIIFQEKSYEDASVILGGVSLGTLRSRMFHALRHLRELLTKVGGEQGQNLL